MAIWLTASIMPGMTIKSFWGAVKVSAVFGVLNWAVGKLLFVMIGLGTLGLGFLFAFLTRWVVNALLLKFTDALSDSLEVKNFKVALVAAAIFGVLATAGEYVVRHLA